MLELLSLFRDDLIAKEKCALHLLKQKLRNNFLTGCIDIA